MVDALREAGRVLVPEGIAIDLRPITALATIEVVATSRTAVAVEIESHGAAEDDAAADAAVRLALAHTWFRFEQSRRFDFEVYCDSAADLKTYVETGRRWRDANIPYLRLRLQLNELGAATGRAGRLLCRRPSILDVYRKGAR